MRVVPQSVFAALAVIFVLLVGGGTARAVIVEELHVESAPPGAKVYLPQGTRNKLLGTTPFVYRAEFHSEVSVHRLVFKKHLYEDQIIKVGVGQEKIRVTLKPVGHPPRKEIPGRASQHELQARVDRIVGKELPHLMEKEPDIFLDLLGPVTVIEEKDGGIAVLNVSLVNWRNKTKGGEAGREAFARGVWDELGPALIVPLAQALDGISGLTGFALDVLYDEQRVVFSVAPSVDQDFEMQCVPGMREELRPVTGYEDGREKTVYQMQSVYDPCIRRVPVARRKVKLAPRTAVQKSRSRGLFLLTLPVGTNQTVPYERLSVFLRDTKGNAVLRQGEVPSSLLIDYR